MVIRYNEPSSEIPRYLLFIGWRLGSIILLFIGVYIITIFVMWIYGFWIAHTITVILIIMPIVGIVLGVLAFLLGVCGIIGGKSGFTWIARIITDWLDK